VNVKNGLFESLLYEEESPTLDFKRDQYRFVKASEDEKSELLKDILGFVNAWRRSEAYILIGVEDVRGQRKRVVGIGGSDHLDDHSLQQFVNNLTNQPVRFHYQAFEFEEKQVGIFVIEEQTRPVYLKRDYGKLLKEKVYVRRGSSTDPMKPASLEEIAQMRIGSQRPDAELVVEFNEIDRDDTRGTEISWDAEFCEMPDRDTIPDLAPPGQHSPFGFMLRDPLNRTNPGFFREMAEFEFVRRLFRPVRLIVRNVGEIAAHNVRVELTIPANIGVEVMSELPARTKEQMDFLNNTVLRGMGSFHGGPGGVSIDRNDERLRIEIECGHLQPGRRIWSEVFYIGKAETGNLSLCGFVFADKLPQPKRFTLSVTVKVMATKITVDELCSMSE
jgi:hypothetical protein